MIMVEHHISMGPVVGCSGGKNILFFLPTLLGIIQTFIFIRQVKIRKKLIVFQRKKPLGPNWSNLTWKF